MDFAWSKVSIPLPFTVQSKFDFGFVYDHLIEPDRKYKGGMQHKMIQF